MWCSSATSGRCFWVAKKERSYKQKQSGEYFPLFEYSLFSMLSVTSDDSYHNPFYNNKKTIDATLQTKQTVVVRCLFNYSYKYANYSTFFV